MNPEQDIFFTIPPESDRVPDEKMMMLRLCRLTIMLIDVFVENKELKTEFFETVNEVVEDLMINKD